MAQSRLLFGVGVLTLACLGGLLGGTLIYWSRQPVFPVYGYIFDAILAVVLVFSVFRLKQWKASISDEFDLAKKRLGTQIGFILGFLLYALVNTLPLLFKHSYDALFSHLDGPREGFILGQVAGMAPFVIGLLIGQVVAWAKYR